MRHLCFCSPLAAASSTRLPQAACCYFSAKNTDILQPAQKVFITWDPAEKVETFTVQPKFEGNALDFGMVIPTPTPAQAARDAARLLQAPRRLHDPEEARVPALEAAAACRDSAAGGAWRCDVRGRRPQGDEAGRTPQAADGHRPGSRRRRLARLQDHRGRAGPTTCYQWLKDNKYSYSGDEATLNFYVQKKWLFTVMKIDTMQMKQQQGRHLRRRSDADALPVRQREARLSAEDHADLACKDKTEALFYVQAPYKVDLPGDMTYQYTWVPMLQGGDRLHAGGLPGGGAGLARRRSRPQIPAAAGSAPASSASTSSPASGRSPTSKGHIPTTMEWARKLTADDIKRPHAARRPTARRCPTSTKASPQADVKDPQRAEAIYKVIRARLAKCAARNARSATSSAKRRPTTCKNLQQLAGHLQRGLFITKFRKIFARDEMNDDLSIVPGPLQRRRDHVGVRGDPADVAAVMSDYPFGVSINLCKRRLNSAGNRVTHDASMSPTSGAIARRWVRSLSRKDVSFMRTRGSRRKTRKVSADGADRTSGTR